MELLRKASAHPCAQCGVSIIAPEWSEYLSRGCVRNVWLCDRCGYQFEDTVYFSAPALHPEERDGVSGVGVWAA
jgi:ribosomal protein L37AE/L43A